MEEMEERNPFKQVMMRLDLLDETLNQRSLPREDILASFRGRSGEEDGFYAKLEEQLAGVRKITKEAAGADAGKDNVPVDGQREQILPTLEAIMACFFHQLDGQRSALEGMDGRLSDLSEAFAALKKQLSETKKASQDEAEMRKLEAKLEAYERMYSDIWHRTFDNRVEAESVCKEAQSAVITDEAWRQYPRGAQDALNAYVNYGNYFFEFYNDIKKILNRKKAR